MKNGFWDRVLIYLFTLLSIALAVVVAIRAFGVDLIGDFFANLKGNAPGILWAAVVSGLALLMTLLGVYVMAAVLPVRVRKRDFITLTNDDNGQVKIALPALREMARCAVAGTEGVKDMTVEVLDTADAIAVSIALDVVSGTHVPTVTMNMQRAVKGYIQSNCGVAVKDVSVVINAVLPAPAAQAAPIPVASELPAAEQPEQAADFPAAEDVVPFPEVEIPDGEISEPEPTAESPAEREGA